MTEEGFGAPVPKERKKDYKYKDSYVEGPWLTKRQGIYQLIYAAGGVPEHIAYSVADSPTGPWKYAGEIMPLGGTNSFTNHAGVVDSKGHSYFFYHTGKLPGGGGFGRSVAVEEFAYNADGSFPVIRPTDKGVEPVARFNPYRRVEGETMAFSRGVTTEQNDRIGVYVTHTHNGDYIKLREVDLGDSGAQTFTARVASGLRGGCIELRADSLQDQLMATLQVPSTGGWEAWETHKAAVTTTLTGVHDLYLCFKGRKEPQLMKLDWWSLKKKR